MILFVQEMAPYFLCQVASWDLCSIFFISIHFGEKGKFLRFFQHSLNSVTSIHHGAKGKANYFKSLKERKFGRIWWHTSFNFHKERDRSRQVDFKKFRSNQRYIANKASKQTSKHSKSLIKVHLILFIMSNSWSFSYFECRGSKIMILSPPRLCSGLRISLGN